MSSVQPALHASPLARRLPRALALLLLACCAASPAHAQFFGGRRAKPIVFQNARIVTGDGAVIDSGSLIIRGERIIAVGAHADAPEDARTIDLKGKTITPGLIDVHSVFGLSSEGRAGDDAAQSAYADFDRYATDDFKEALRNGVTTVHVGPVGGAGIRGAGAVVRLAAGDGPWGGVPMDENASLVISLGSDNSPLRKVAVLAGIRQALQDALDLRETREIYDEELEEYEKKVKERAEKEKAEQKDADKSGEKSGDKPKPPGAPPADNGGGEHGPPANGNGEKKDKEEELKKPTEPRPNPSADVLLKALDRQLPVRIEAENSEDILNAIELANDFKLNATIVGAEEADLVADQLAASELPVILFSPRAGDRTDRFGNPRSPGAAAHALASRDVPFTLGSGPGAGASRLLLFHAQLLAADADPDHPIDPIRLCTLDAARTLNIADRVGSLRPGKLADIIVWSGDPLDPASRVESAYVNGELVYRPESPDEQDKDAQ